MINEKYQFHSLLRYKNIAHGISSKFFGSIKKDEKSLDRKALAKFGQNLSIVEDVVCMKQIHSGTVQVVENNAELRFSDTDALITNKKNLPLAVLTADCLPVLFYDPKQNIIAVAHAGYKGLLNHIFENTISRFVSNFLSDQKDIIVGIGSGIERDCYEVGEDRIEEFRKVFPSFKDMFAKKDGNFYLDLRSIARQCLIKEGILEEHIEIMDICTKCNPNFYSYRRGDKYQRFASIISLV